MTTMTETPNIKTLAKCVQVLKQAHADEVVVLNAYRNTAGKTPTGRIKKESRLRIEAQELKCSDAYSEYKNAGQRLLDAVAAERRATADTRLEANLGTVRIVTGGKDITSLYADKYDDFLKESGKNYENNFRNGQCFVLDVTPSEDGLKGVRSVHGYGSNREESCGDYHIHLFLCFADTGDLHSARIFHGKVLEKVEGRPTSSILENSHGFDLCGDRDEFSISSCRGTTSEIKAYAKTVLVAMGVQEKLAGLLTESRRNFDYHEPITVAERILA